MAQIDILVQDFLAQKRIAVVGVSDRRDTGCNLAYRKFKENDYTVYAVNPRITIFEGEVVDKIEKSEWGFPVVQVKVTMTNQEGSKVVVSTNEVELPY